MNHQENNIKAHLTGLLFSTSESLLIEQSNHWTMGVLPEQNVSQGTWTRIVFTGSFACIWSETSGEWEPFTEWLSKAPNTSPF